jgi:hypothetical protein
MVTIFTLRATPKVTALGVALKVAAFDTKRLSRNDDFVVLLNSTRLIS